MPVVGRTSRVATCETGSRPTGDSLSLPLLSESDASRKLFEHQVR